VLKKHGTTNRELSDERERAKCDDFIIYLASDINKVVNFYLDREADILLRTTALSKEYKSIKGQNEKVEEKAALSQGLRSLEEDILKLLRFASLNVMGIRKILKKHDKQIKDLPALTTIFLGLTSRTPSPLWTRRLQDKSGFLERLTKSRLF